MAAMDAMPLEVAILDEEGTVVAVNGSWREFADQNHGMHPDYWVGENYFAICRQSEDELAGSELVEPLQAVIDGDRDRYQNDYPCHSPEEQRWFRMEATRFQVDDQPYLLVVHTNITDLIRAERQASAYAEKLQTMVEILHHDLRNPLQVIMGRADLLGREVDESEHIDSIRRAATRISEITEATLAFSQSGELSDPKPLSVGHLARTAWESVTAEEASLVIAESRRIIGDEQLLLQLFENLFRNTIDHVGPACRVQVGACEDGFYVEDDGPGIPEYIREKAIQADYSTKGGGLGLAIVQSVVRAHGGELTITDAADGGARIECTGFEIPPAQEHVHDQRDGR